jgi:hypothetical protein
MSKFLEQYKTYEDLSQYCLAQNETLIKYAKQIVSLQEEIVHLKSLLSGTTSAVPAFQIEPSGFDEDLSDEEVVSKIEIQKLKAAAFSRELTYEEAKKLETYTKILNAKPKKPEKDAIDVTKVSTKDLLAELENGKGEQ